MIFIYRRAEPHPGQSRIPIKERVDAISGGTVESAIRFFEIHFHPEIIEKGISEAREEFLKAKAHLSPMTLRQLKNYHDIQARELS